MPRPNNYDSIAAYYDRIATLVFGQSLRHAQESLLPVIKPGDHVLIVGGGTGWILEAIAAYCPQGLQITYVELSAKMTAQSRTRYAGLNTVTFINDSITAQALLAAHYDIVFTAFLFDNFLPGDAVLLFEQLHKTLKPQGHWLFADFEVKPAQRYWQKPLLQIMYTFFRVFCNIQAQQLNDLDAMFNAHAYTLIKQERFYKDFITAAVYRKPA